MFIQNFLSVIMSLERDLLDGLADLDLNIGDENDDGNEEITHTLPFKCIGAAHENDYQQHLEQAHLVLHKQEKPVKVALRPETVKDANAIAIDMDYGTEWIHVGYIASELCKYLHPLIATGDIVDVFVQHIVFRVEFLNIGFYPKIMITRRGEWEPMVVRKSNKSNLANSFRFFFKCFHLIYL